MAKKEREIIETFMSPSYMMLKNLKQKEPSCFNGLVRVRRYRITIEEIPESKEVIEERLEKLWVESDNSHHMKPLNSVASSMKYKFKGTWASKRKEKK